MYITTQNRFDTCDEFFCVKWFHDIVIRTQFQTKNLVEGFSFGGQHDHREIRCFAKLPEYIVAAHSRKHDVQYNQIRLVVLNSGKCLLAIIGNLCIETFLDQV